VLLVRKRVEPESLARPGAKATACYSCLIGVNQAFVFDEVRIAWQSIFRRMHLTSRRRRSGRASSHMTPELAKSR
jgi:hypothetical protein